MQLVLAIPGLLDLARAEADGPHVHAPELARLLARAASRRIEPDGLLAALAPRFGIARQTDWPFAPIAASAAGVKVDAQYWLRATPVTLEPGRDDVRLVGEVADLDAAEASALLDTLAAHFRDDGLAFVAPRPSDWFVGMRDAPALSTRDLATVIGRPLRRHLPTGADAPLWLRWEQEIEMLLHEHPVNEARARAGRAVVNAVWFQHGGRLPPRHPQRDLATWSADPDVAAMASHAESPVRKVPAGLAEVLDAPTSRQLVMLTPALDPGSLDERFVLPAARALAGGRLEALELVAHGRGTPAAAWTIERLRWWRRLGGGRTLPLPQVLAEVLQGSP